MDYSSLYTTLNNTLNILSAELTNNLDDTSNNCESNNEEINNGNNGNENENGNGNDSEKNIIDNLNDSDDETDVVLHEKNRLKRKYVRKNKEEKKPDSVDDDIKALENIIPSQLPDPITDKYYDDFKQNYLKPEDLAILKKGITGDLEHFTQVSLVIMTLRALIAGFSHKEEDLIKKLNVNSRVVCIECNFGKKKHEWFKHPKEYIVKSTRGRKKKPKQKKERKTQGNGTCFGSQIRFTMLINDIEKDKKLTVNDLYDFMIFRNGYTQTYDIKIEKIDNLITNFYYLIDYLNTSLKNELKMPLVLISLCPIMKNYKFWAKIDKTENLYLNGLKNVLRLYESKNRKIYNPDNKYFLTKYMRIYTCKCITHINQEYLHDINTEPLINCPSKIMLNPHFIQEKPLKSKIIDITEINYTGEDAKLYVIFNYNKHKVHVNAFMPDKFNILSSNFEEITQDIVNFLQEIVITYRDIVVKKPNLITEEKLIDNLEDITIEQINDNNKLVNPSYHLYDIYQNILDLSKTIIS